ncbi:MAG: hypothetical protein ACTSPB_02335 [Candidatus Thorarchaeota archaeon]
MVIIIYTQPRCKNCKVLKDRLKAEKIDFEERRFDTEVQTEMIMRNLFDDPPFLGVGEEVIPSTEIFDSEGQLRPSVVECLLSTQGVDK